MDEIADEKNPDAVPPIAGYDPWQERGASVPEPDLLPEQADDATFDELAGDVDEIERAYQQALAAMEDLPWQEPEVSNAPLPTGADRSNTATGPADVAPAADAAADGRGVHSTTGPENAAPASAPRKPAEKPELPGPSVTPAQVIEAALFVGGTPLSARKIAELLRGTIDKAAVERTIEQLNEQYVSESRPYEIRLGDGGYRLELRPQYEKLRHRVYGVGPREVRLSQDALEVLAIVAYQQPIAQSGIEAHGKQNAGNLLRQLLRRDLVAIDRSKGSRKDVKYQTTPRFLSVFGLGSLSELPAPEDLARK